MVLTALQVLLGRTGTIGGESFGVHGGAGGAAILVSEGSKLTLFDADLTGGNGGAGGAATGGTGIGPIGADGSVGADGATGGLGGSGGLGGDGTGGAGVGGEGGAGGDALQLVDAKLVARR